MYAILRNASVQSHIGSKYIKCLYFGYTDDTYETRTSAPEHLGFLGPIIYAEVGDRVHIKYKNECGFANSVHAHGVVYDKGSEGAPSDDDTKKADMKDDAVPPNGSYTFKWVRALS